MDNRCGFWQNIALRAASAGEAVFLPDESSSSDGSRLVGAVPLSTDSGQILGYLVIRLTQSDLNSLEVALELLDIDAAGLPFHRRLDPPEPGPAQDLPPLFRVEAVLRFSPALAGRVRDEFDPRCVEEEPGGSLLVRAILSREAELEGWLLSFGPGLEILAPDDLRQRTAALAEELARRHGEAPGPA